MDTDLIIRIGRLHDRLIRLEERSESIERYLVILIEHQLGFKTPSQTVRDLEEVKGGTFHSHTVLEEAQESLKKEVESMEGYVGVGVDYSQRILFVVIKEGENDLRNYVRDIIKFYWQGLRVEIHTSAGFGGN